jgi:hypothetical protein
LLVVDGGFQVEETFEEENFTCARNFLLLWGIAQCARLHLIIIDLNRLPKEPSALRHYISLHLCLIPSVILPFDKSWKLLTIHRGHCRIFSWNTLSRSQIRSGSRTFNTRDLRLLDCINELLDCLLEKVDLSHLDLFILSDSCFNDVESSLVKFLGFD